MSAMVETADLITIGKIERPFGVRGEVRVRSLSDVPGRFEQLTTVTLVTPSGRALTTEVTHVRAGGSSYIVGLKAFGSPEEAATFRGSLVQIPREETPPLPVGEYYEYDLVGMTVRNEVGQQLGVLEEVWDLRSHHVFAVRRDDQEILVPATKQAIMAVDVPGRIMTVRESEVVGDGHAV